MTCSAVRAESKARKRWMPTEVFTQGRSGGAQLTVLAAAASASSSTATRAMNDER